MAVIVPILSTFNDKGIKSAVREFRTAKTQIDKFGAVGKIFEGVGKSLTKNVTAPIIGVGLALATTLRPAIEAAAAQQRLTQILKTTGTASDTQIASLLKQAEALEKIGVVSKENVIATQSQLATFDLQGTTIEALTPAILDYVTAEKGATASTEDFKSMTNSLAQALNGQFGGLTRVGFVLDDATKKQIANGTEAERTQAIIEVLNSTYKGFNESLRDTPEGQLVRLQNALGKVREEIGTALLPMLASLSDFISETFVPAAVEKIRDFTKAWNDLGPTLQKIIIGVVVFSAVIGPALIVVGKIIGALYGLITALGATKVALALTNVAMGKTVVAAGALRIALIKTGIGAVVIALAALAAAFVNAWETSYEFRNRVREALNSVVKAAEIFVNVIIQRLNALLPGLNKIIRGMQAIGISVEEIAPIAQVAFNQFEMEAKPFGGVILGMSERAKDMAGVFREDVAPSIGDAGNAADKAKKRLEKLKKALIELRQQAVDKLKTSLSDAQSKLDDAKSAFDNFKKSIKNAITETVDFQKAGTGADFFERLQDQAEKAKGFADRIKKLIRMGLSKTALQQIIDAGADAGSVIADNIIAGGAAMVKDVNKLVAAIDKVAEEAGQAGAVKFYNQGIIMGESIVAGILAALQAAQAALDAAMQGNFSKAKKDNKKAPKKGDGSKKKKRENGGPVTGGFTYLVGERGPELFSPFTSGSIIPNDRARRMSSGGGGVTININAGNVVGSRDELLAFIQKGLREYDRRNGRLNING
jgi:hypothetical protein